MECEDLQVFILMSWVTLFKTEKLHGLEPVNTLPKIYYEPEIHSDVKDIFIVDFTSISIDYDQQELKNILEKVKTLSRQKVCVGSVFKTSL